MYKHFIESGVNLLAKIKIYEIAKELKIDNKDVLETAKKMGLKVTSHLSGIEENDVKRLKENLKKSEKDIKPEKMEKKAKTEKKDEIKTTGQIIIRREVIVEDKKQETNKNQKNGIGFNVQRRNKDFNIVYREKPTKPMTVNELFGIKPKATKKEEPKVEEKKKVENKVESAATEKVEAPKQPEIKEPETKKNNEKINNETKTISKEVKAETKIMENKQTNKSFNKDNFNRNGYNKENNQREGFSKDRNFNKNGRDGFARNNRDGNNYRDNRGFRNNNSQDSKFGNRNNNSGFNKEGSRSFRDNNNNGSSFKRDFKQRPANNKSIDKNIKDIVSIDIMEKDNQRDYSTKIIDKQKANRNLDDKKKNNRNRRGSDEESFDEDKLRDLKQVNRLSNMFEDQEGGMLDYYDLTTARGKKNKKKAKKDGERNKQKIFELKEITIPSNISVKDLATDLKKTSTEVIKKLFDLGIMANINQTLDFDTAYLVADAFGVMATKKEEIKDEDILFDDSEDKEEDLQQRPPVVVVMGHVDHGKTSLLDAIRQTNVIEGEAGGITQHIGAYKVNVNGREITFLDTPGHEAFTSMRARGAQITDIAILVIAADDGVMPQTVEAINHAKAAGIPIIVAVNKIDLPGANVDKVKQELMKYELVPEEWGGDTIFVPISAKKNINIDNLLEMVLLVADMQNLRANPNRQSKGTVIEARLDKAQGPIASVLVQRGTLNVGDTIILGTSIGKIRTMKNDKGKMVREAGPSTPVEITGLHEVPEAGDVFYEVKNEKVAKHLIEQRKLESREKALNNTEAVTLDNLFDKMASEDLKQLNIIVKADVQGTAEAMKSSLEKLSNDEVRVSVIHSSAGGVTESDVQLAKAANAIIIAFNVRPVGAAKNLAEKDGVEIKQYSVIYQAIEDVQDAMKGMLAPVYKEVNIGNAEVRQTFRISNVGTIAGCFVLDGKLERNAGVRVIREGVVIHDGKLVSLKRFKDDAKEVSKGFECGLQIEDYNDLKEGDTIEAYIKEEVKR
ncbi:translation initiation factor IF-2 [Clostridium sp. CAG:793]|nr:translation initiation factor IF-2 [Clostridium sp. CAG:793]